MGPSKDQRTAMACAVVSTLICFLIAAVSLLFTGTFGTILLVVAAVGSLVSMFFLSLVSPDYNGGGKVVLGFISLPVNWLCLGFFMTWTGFGIYAVASVLFYGAVCLLTSRSR